jgi:hypothetical protein
LLSCSNRILLAFPKRYSALRVALQTGYNQMRLSFGPCSNAAIDAHRLQRVASLTNSTSIFPRQSDFSCHGYPSGSFNVPTRKFRVGFVSCISLFTQNSNPFLCYQFCGGIHPALFTLQVCNPPITCFSNLTGTMIEKVKYSMWKNLSPFIVTSSSAPKG